MVMSPPLEMIIDAYGLDGSVSLSPMTVHQRIDIDRRPAFLLKRFSSDASHTNAVWRRLCFLDSRGFSPSPLWRRQKNGHPALEWRDGFWILIPWLKGLPAPVFSNQGFPKLLKLLSFLHRLGQGYHESEVFNPARIYTQRLKDLEEGFYSDSSEFAENYRRLLAGMLYNARRAVQLLSDVTADPISDWTICHGDPSGRNTFNLGDGRWTFVDWDRAIPAPRWWELSQALRRYGERNGWKRWPSWTVINRDVQPVLGYQEKIALWCCLLFPHALWRLGDQYFREKLKRPDRWYMERLESIRRLEIHRLLTLQDWGTALRSKPK